MNNFLFLFYIIPALLSSENEICTAIKTKNKGQIIQWVEGFFEDHFRQNDTENHLTQRMAEVALCIQHLESQACIDSVKLEGIMESLPAQVDLHVFHSQLESNTYLSIRLRLTRPITTVWANEFEKAEEIN